jgi:hypothetical protein
LAPRHSPRPRTRGRPRRGLAAGPHVRRLSRPSAPIARPELGVSSAEAWLSEVLTDAGLDSKKSRPKERRTGQQGVLFAHQPLAIPDPSREASPFPPVTNSRLLDPECSPGVSSVDKSGSWRNARMPLPVASDEGLGVRVIRPQVLTGGPSTKVVAATRSDLYYGRVRSCSRVDGSCVYRNCRNTRHANKADSQRPNGFSVTLS